MSNIQQGWQQYRRGNFDQAAAAFKGSDQPEALAGRALSLVASGRADEAQALVEHQLQRRQTPDGQALLADIMGRQGNRSEARKILEGISRQHADVGFYRTLLGEQYIRLGQWEDGTNEFIGGLNNDDGRAFPHIQNVIVDMIDAVAARRIPRQDATRFINRIDYSASDKSQAMNSFFAAARRALNGNRRMDRGDLIEHWSANASTNTSRQTPRSPSTTPQTPPPQQSNRQPPNRPPKQRRQRRTNNRRNRSTQRSRSKPSSDSTGDTQSPAQERKAQMQKRLAQRNEDAQRSQDLLMDSNRKNMTVIMQQEREQNECLQDLVAQVRPPIWPSETDEPIDIIEPIGFSQHSILRGSNSIDTANFRITGGEIGVEISLERCMHNLIAAASSVKPTSLPLNRASIPRIELNLLDDFLEHMPSLDDLYRDETEIDDSRPLAIGKFIGECIVQSYGGVWNHREPAEKSVIHLGDHTLDPIGLAQRFEKTDNFDAVSLSELIADAEEAVDSSTSFPTFTDVLDPTSGLEGEALTMQLAELWASYRFILPDMTIPRIAESLQIIHDTPSFIAFTIDADFTPDFIVDELDGAVDKDHRTRMAYIRSTGEFLLLASAKYFCRMMEVSDVNLSHQHSAEIARWLQHLYRPGWPLMIDRDTAQTWRKKLDTSNLKPPSLQQKERNVAIAVQAINSQHQLRTIKLVYRPDKPTPYQLRID